MYYAVERAKTIRNELERRSILKTIPLDSWQFKEGFYVTPKEAHSAPAPFCALHLRPGCMGRSRQARMVLYPYHAAAFGCGNGGIAAPVKRAWDMGRDSCTDAGIF